MVSHWEVGGLAGSVGACGSCGGWQRANPGGGAWQRVPRLAHR